MTLSTSAVAVCCCKQFAQLVEQPSVLDGDDGLGSEVRDQRDLLVGKRTDFLAENGERTDQFVLFEHRDNDNCPHTPKFNRCYVFRALLNVPRLCRKVGEVNHRLGRQEATKRAFRTGTKR